jgi:hypothetical protein
MAHQLAAVHQLSMRFAAKANEWLNEADPRVSGIQNGQLAMVEAQRAANACGAERGLSGGNVDPAEAADGR